MSHLRLGAARGALLALVLGSVALCVLFLVEHGGSEREGVLSEPGVDNDASTAGGQQRVDAPVVAPPDPTGARPRNEAQAEPAQATPTPTKVPAETPPDPNARFDAKYAGLSPKELRQTAREQLKEVTKIGHAHIMDRFEAGLYEVLYTFDPENIDPDNPPTASGGSGLYTGFTDVEVAPGVTEGRRAEVPRGEYPAFYDLLAEVNYLLRKTGGVSTSWSSTPGKGFLLPRVISGADER